MEAGRGGLGVRKHRQAGTSNRDSFTMRRVCRDLNLLAERRRRIVPTWCRSVRELFSTRWGKL